MTFPTDALPNTLWAVALVWGWAFVAGYPFARMLRVPIGLAGIPLIGMAVWGASVYLLPFRDGQTIAMIVVLLTFAVSIRRTGTLARDRTDFKRKSQVAATILLLLVLLALHTVPLMNRVPTGMDASMHASGARILAENRGLAKTYAPFADTLPFPALNLGLPALAAVAMRCGATVEAASLATISFAFSGFLLGTYVLCRRWVPPFLAAALATYGLFFGRELLETIVWGGYPTVAGYALGAIAARILLDLSRRPSLPSGIVAGLCVAGLPLIHGVSAAAWAYVVAPLVVIIGVGKVRRWKPVLLASGVAAIVVGLVLGCYLSFGYTEISDWAREWTREHQQHNAPRGEGMDRLADSFKKLQIWSGNELTATFAIASIVLLVRKGVKSLILLLVPAMIFAVIVNSAFWKLPASILLYPERTPLLMSAFVPVCLALAWRSLPLESRRHRFAWGLIALLLVGYATPNFHARYLRHALAVATANRTHPIATVDAEEYAALRWCGANLDPKRDVVAGPYNSAATYLPAVAGIATTGWHIHVFILQEQSRFFESRPPTYRMVILSIEGEPHPKSGIEVFRNSKIVILRLRGE